LETELSLHLLLFHGHDWHGLLLVGFNDSSFLEALDAVEQDRSTVMLQHLALNVLSFTCVTVADGIVHGISLGIPKTSDS
jgi:hypothetical protein